MRSDDVPRLKRSYHRNLNWCRFWLGIGLAVATLTFTFGVNQVFAPLFENNAGGAFETSGTPNYLKAASFTFAGVAVLLLLMLVVSVCASLAAVFRELYLRDDRSLSAIAQTHEEATP